MLVERHYGLEGERWGGWGTRLFAGRRPAASSLKSIFRVRSTLNGAACTPIRTRFQTGESSFLYYLPL